MPGKFRLDIFYERNGNNYDNNCVYTTGNNNALTKMIELVITSVILAIIWRWYLYLLRIDGGNDDNSDNLNYKDFTNTTDTNKHNNIDSDNDGHGNYDDNNNNSKYHD